MCKKTISPPQDSAMWGNASLPPGHPPVKCGARPECEGCTYPAHGFVCQFADGSCLRYATAQDRPENAGGIPAQPAAI